MPSGNNLLASLSFLYKMSTKQSVSHNIMTCEAIYRVKPLLEQIADGLKSCMVLRAIQDFPDLYLPLFVDTGEINLDDPISLGE